MDNIIERISLLLLQNNMTAKELTQLLKISKTAVSEWKSGKLKPSTEALIGISQIFNVSLDWLLTGKSQASNISFSGSVTGSNTVVQGGNSANITVQNNDTPKQEISKQATELIKIFEDLDARSQMKLFSTALELESQNSKK